jgi:hypothetical protein
MRLGWIAIGVAAGALALAGGLWTRATPEPAPADVAARSPQAELEALRAALATERDARLSLQAEVEMLREVINDLGAGTRFDAPSAHAPTADAATAAPAPTEAPAESADPASWFDAAGLAALGLSESEVERLRLVFEESELEAIELRNQAQREGWAATPRFVQATQLQLAALRESLGDELYDRYLYASRRSNRVLVREVLSISPAARAGVRPDDLILSYDGKRIFGWRDLVRAAAQGEAGRSVPLEVMSPEGSLRRLTIPSGPIGIRLREERRAPQVSG